MKYFLIPFMLLGMSSWATTGKLTPEFKCTGDYTSLKRQVVKEREEVVFLNAARCAYFNGDTEEARGYLQSALNGPFQSYSARLLSIRDKDTNGWKISLTTDQGALMKVLGEYEQLRDDIYNDSEYPLHTQAGRKDEEYIYNVFARSVHYINETSAFLLYSLGTDAFDHFLNHDGTFSDEHSYKKSLSDMKDVINIMSANVDFCLNKLVEKNTLVVQKLKTLGHRVAISTDSKERYNGYLGTNNAVVDSCRKMQETYLTFIKPPLDNIDAGGYSKLAENKEKIMLELKRHFQEIFNEGPVNKPDNYQFAESDPTRGPSSIDSARLDKKPEVSHEVEEFLRDADVQACAGKLPAKCHVRVREDDEGVDS